MTKLELEYILQEGESYLVEFKEKVKSSLSRELTAFANASGGRIFIGVDDNGIIKRISNSNKTKSQIQDIANNCQPSIGISISEFQNIIIIQILEGREKPYQCADGFFIRMGANSQKMTRDHIIEFLQAEGQIRFEDQFHPKFDFDKHYDSSKLNNFLRMADITKNLDDSIILENLGVAEIVSGKLKMKNVGVLFFAKSVETICEQATITCAVFDGKDRISILNRKDYSDDIVTNINNALHFVKQELRVKYVMTGKAQREESYEIPLEVMREAIVNAVAHWDYFLYGSHTTIEIFDDRIEITNPGGLPKGLSEKDFGTKAVRRNQITAALLQRINLVENMGTGINKIKKLLKESGNKDATFKFEDFFTIIFFRESSSKIKNGGVSDGVNGGVSDGVNQVFKFIESNPKIKVKDIQKQLKFSTRTIERYIKILKEKKIIEFKGSPKIGGYFVTESDKSP